MRGSTNPCTSDCCDPRCDGRQNHGVLSGGTIDVNPDPGCLGGTITFTASGVVDEGGLKRVDCTATREVAGVSPAYTWELTVPAGYPAPLAPLSGSGSVVSVAALVPGAYSCAFTASADRDCRPDDRTLTPATATAIELTSQTEATTPADRTRTTLGIGEIVTISTNPATTVDWSRTGGGSIPDPPPSGPSIPFTASMSPSTSTILATLSGGAMCEIAFSVIAPTGMTCAVLSETGCGTPGPPNNTIGSRAFFDCTVQPTTVSFYNAQFRENIPGEAWTWPDGTGGSWPITVNPWHPTQANQLVDDVEWCGEPIGHLDPPPAGGGYIDFSVDVRVPEEYLNKDGIWVQWLPETQTQEYRGVDAASRGIINATNTATSTWQGPWQ